MSILCISYFIEFSCYGSNSSPKTMHIISSYFSSNCSLHIFNFYKASASKVFINTLNFLHCLRSFLNEAILIRDYNLLFGPLFFFNTTSKTLFSASENDPASSPRNPGLEDFCTNETRDVNSKRCRDINFPISQRQR